MQSTIVNGLDGRPTQLTFVDPGPQGALAGELIKCGTTLPKGGCTKATGQVFQSGSSQ